MRFTASTFSPDTADYDAIVVPIFSDGVLPDPIVGLLGSNGRGLAEIGARLRLREPGDSSWVVRESGSPDILLVCVGRPASESGSIEDLRTAAMVAGRTVNASRVASLLSLACGPNGARATIVTEAWAMGAYRFDRYRATASPRPSQEVAIVGGEESAVKSGAIIGAAAGTARDLVNTPGADLSPQALADTCQKLGAAHGFSVKVTEADQLAEQGFAGLVAVGAGSSNPPVLIELERGELELPHVALVGKGVTFDAGGLSLKTTSDMRTMKADMAGAASILGALIAADRLGARTHVKAYLACAENLPGPSALRVGDVICHRNGLSTEVLDTDCEGRLVLSDVLSFAAESRPAQLIDIATLSSSTGLGPELWAVLGTDEEVVRRLLEAGAASGEPGWRLPLWDGYESRLESDVADLKNFDATTASGFGAVYAALYLRYFVADVPWAHIDLGLTVMRAAPTSAWAAGANGNGTRTLARYLLDTDRPGGEAGSPHHTGADN